MSNATVLLQRTAEPGPPVHLMALALETAVGDGMEAAMALLPTQALHWHGLAAAPPWREALAEEGFVVRSWQGQPLADADLHLVWFSGPVAAQLPLVHRLRRCWPLAVLVALGDAMRPLDQVLLLEAGADDALPAQVPPVVVAAKLRRLLLVRRQVVTAVVPQPAANADPTTLHAGTLELRKTDRSARAATGPMALGEAEFDLLWLLAERLGQTVSRAQLVRSTRGIDYDGLDRSIDCRVYRLRRSLARAGPGAPTVRTVRHQGYALVVG